MMNEKVKNYFGVAAAFALIVGAFSAVWYATTYSRSIDRSYNDTFFVSADAKVTVIPDVAQFWYSVITEGSMDVGSLQSENNKKTNAIIDFLKSSGVEDKDIKTVNWSVEPRYEYYNCAYDPQFSGYRTPEACPPPKIVGYTVKHSVLVKVRDMEKAGTFLSEVVSKGANDVSGLSFTVDEPDKYREQAREEAIKKAKEKAKNVAKAGGFSMGRLLGIHEENDYYKYGGYGGGSDMAKSYAEEVPSPSIEPGSQEISITMVLTYEIK